MLSFKVGLLVVWRGSVVPIVNRWVHPDGITYLIHTKSKTGELVSDIVTFGQLVCEINHYARWCVGDRIEVNGWDRYIKARWWSFKRGDVLYRLNDFLDEGRNRVVLTQSDLIRRVEQDGTLHE